MAKYYVVHSCGHEHQHQLYGKNSDRERKIEWLEGNLCPDCYRDELEKERQASNMAAAEENKAAGLPTLQGTEKQVAWAETIRAKMIDLLFRQQRCLLGNIERLRSDHEYAASMAERAATSKRRAEGLLGYETHEERAMACLDAIDTIMEIDAASWWIDHRDHLVNLLVQNMAKEAGKRVDGVDAMPEAEEAKKEALLLPQEQISNTPAEISAPGDTVQVKYPVKNRSFWEIIKPGLGFSWTGEHWKLRLGVTSGEQIDRMAETGHRLLAAGFPVIIYDKPTRTLAMSGEYVPRHTRWVTFMISKERFAIRWDRNEDFYSEARKINSARWDKPYITVSPAEWAEVVDFAEMFDFKISPGGMKVIAEQQNLLAAGTVVDVAPLPANDAIDRSRPELDPDQITGEINADLIDDWAYASPAGRGQQAATGPGWCPVYGYGHWQEPDRHRAGL